MNIRNGKITVTPEVAARVHEQAKQVYSGMVQGYAYDGWRLTPLPAVDITKTIMGRLVSPDELLRVKLVYPPDGPDDRWRMACEVLLGGGLEHEGRRFRVLGAGSSLKKGVIWLGTDDVRAMVHRFFATSQEALSYTGALLSMCSHGIHRLNLRGMVVKDGESGTADGQGYVTPSLLDTLGLPRRQVQIRMVCDQDGGVWLAKGTVVPRELPDGIDVLIPDSMVKGRGMPVDGDWSVLFGIREIAQVRRYNSSFSLSMWFGDEVFDALTPVVDKRLAVLRDALKDRDHALRFVGQLHGDDELDDARTVAEAFLQAGLSPQHPWLRRQLLDLQRQAYARLALGGGIELTGRMAAHADLPDGVVCATDLPAGRIAVSRFPIRDPHSLMAATNKPDAVSDALPGTIYVGNTIAKQLDGDFDGDALVCCVQDAVVREVNSRNWYPSYRRQDVPPKRRLRDSLALLPFIAVASIGNNIGSLSYAIAAAQIGGEPQRIPVLSANLQLEVQSLKWDCRANRKLLEDFPLLVPAFIAETKTDRDVFRRKTLCAEGTHPLAKNYNRVAQAWKKVAEMHKPLIDFRSVIPVWSDPKALDFAGEAMAVNQLYGRWIASIIEQVGEPTREDLDGPLQFLKAWDASKTDDRRAWAVATWAAVHTTRSEASTGSMAFHVMTEEMLTLIADTVYGGRVSVPPRDHATAAEFTMLPLVGAAHELDGGLRGLFDLLPDPSTVVKVETMPGDEGNARFYTGGIYIGQIPRDHILHGAVPFGLQFDAHLVIRGRTVFMAPVSVDWMTAVQLPMT